MIFKTLIFSLALSFVVQANDISPNTDVRLVLGSRNPENSIMKNQTQLFAEEIKHRTGIQLVFEYVPSKRSLQLANNGVLDGEAGRIKALVNNEDYANLRIVDGPWTRAHYVVLQKAGSHRQIQSYSDLVDKKVCHTRGQLMAPIRLKQYAIEQVFTSTTNEQVIHMLVQDRCDAVLYFFEQSNPEIVAFLKENRVSFKTVLEQHNGYIFLHKKHQALIPILESALKTIEKDGTRALITSQFNKY